MKEYRSFTYILCIFYTKTRKQTPKRPETLKLAMVSMPGKTDNSIGSRGLVNSDLAPQRLRHMHNMQQAALAIGLAVLRRACHVAADLCSLVSGSWTSRPTPTWPTAMSAARRTPAARAAAGRAVRTAHRMVLKLPKN